MTTLIAQLVTIACAELGLPPAVTQALVTAAANLAGMIPAAQLEKLVFAVMKEGAKWLITRRSGPAGNPDMGGNQQAENPPIVLDQPPGDPGPLP